MAVSKDLAPLYVIDRSSLGRWYILLASDRGYAWSGARWVPFVQVCNFATAEEAEEYAKVCRSVMAAAHHPHTWRVGRQVPINVYLGDSPVCQCHTPEMAQQIVDAMNAHDKAMNVRTLLHEADAALARGDNRAGWDAVCRALREAY